MEANTTDLQLSHCMRLRACPYDREGGNLTNGYIHPRSLMLRGCATTGIAPGFLAVDTEGVTMLGLVSKVGGSCIMTTLCVYKPRQSPNGRIFQNNPTTLPDSGSSPTSQNPGRVPSPGMVCISPRSGYKNPAPAESRTARIGTVKPIRGSPKVRSAGEFMDRYKQSRH